MAELSLKVIGKLATTITNIENVQALLRHHDCTDREVEPLHWQMQALLDMVEQWRSDARSHPERASATSINMFQKLLGDATSLKEEISDLLDRMNVQSFWDEHLWPLCGKPTIDKMSIECVEIMKELSQGAATMPAVIINTPTPSVPTSLPSVAPVPKESTEPAEKTPGLGLGLNATTGKALTSPIVHSADQTNSEENSHRVRQHELQVATHRAQIYRNTLSKHQCKDVDSKLQNTPPWDRTKILSLLDQGADPDARPDSKSSTALYNAASCGEIETVKLLLDRGAQVDVKGGKHNTAFTGALMANQMETAVLLLERGADINHKHGIGDSTPLGHVLLHGDGKPHKGLVAFLLEHGADADKSIGAGLSPVAFIRGRVCSHSSPKHGCKKCADKEEWLEITEMLTAYGGQNSITKGFSKVIDFFADPSIDSDPEVAAAGGRLKKAKAAKRRREEDRMRLARAEYGDNYQLMEQAARRQAQGTPAGGEESDPEVAEAEEALARAKVHKREQKRFAKQIGKAVLPPWWY
ncbi:uncharacterized protein A1O5_13098 [Cladophialophora psammophila CBS 110553]|uniref:Uncharacterized protein n=1 Tax=Cladophialophora psammophila CBS 110553 TaxID=1182543 RepID=W9VDG0_9EURO|nr:uncharacterized protein A1O5_13098 [Cladophialophora psammophila CBS 110553]EXJ53647.1 hypothetical protein A1O5_13098 [Cladophialophora psammophila CBS 110553]